MKFDFNEMLSNAISDKINEIFSEIDDLFQMTGNNSDVRTPLTWQKWQEYVQDKRYELNYGND
jgi:hypothetical protein